MFSLIAAPELRAHYACPGTGGAIVSSSIYLVQSLFMRSQRSTHVVRSSATVLMTYSIIALPYQCTTAPSEQYRATTKRAMTGSSQNPNSVLQQCVDKRKLFMNDGPGRFQYLAYGCPFRRTSLDVSGQTLGPFRAQRPAGPRTKHTSGLD